MGRIIVQATITNALDRARQIVCLGLVDTGSTGLVLPNEWKERLGNLETLRMVSMETADQRVVHGEVCGPVRVELEGFPPVMTEVTFLAMEPVNGGHEPLIGYIVLEQSQAAVDMVSHRLVRVPYVDLKCVAA